MSAATRTIRQSVSLPNSVASRVRSMAKRRRLSTSRMMVELIEKGIQAEEQKRAEFFELAEKFRAAKNPEEIKLLGEELGRAVFGS